MAGCISCFIIPLLLFLFHRFIQPIILKFWNPWQSDPKKGENEALECLKSGQCKRGGKAGIICENGDTVDRKNFTVEENEAETTCGNGDTADRKNHMD